MPNRKFFSKHLTAASPSPAVVTTKSAYVHSVVITCSVIGGAFTITDGQTPPKILVPAFTPIVPVDGLPNVDRTFEQPQRMRQGINIVTPGTFPTMDVQITCSVSEEE